MKSTKFDHPVVGVKIREGLFVTFSGYLSTFLAMVAQGRRLCPGDWNNLVLFEVDISGIYNIHCSM